MTIAASEPRTVVLRDRSVTLAALRVLWELEARGLSFEVVGDELFVGPSNWITADDAAKIREHKWELIALVGWFGGVQ